PTPTSTTTPPIRSSTPARSVATPPRWRSSSRRPSAAPRTPGWSPPRSISPATATPTPTRTSLFRSSARTGGASTRSTWSPSARLDASLRRLLVMKEQLGLFRRRTVNLDSLGYIVGRRAHRDTALAVSARSLVLVRDSLGLVDSLRAGPRPLAVITFADGNS